MFNNKGDAMTGQINIRFKNCRNISSIEGGAICVKKDTLNVIFAANGTGKTTLAKVCSYLSSSPEDKRNSLEGLKSFTCLANPGQTEFEPSIPESSIPMKVAVFNEEWVEKHCFMPDTLRDNTFKLFVESEEYRRLTSNRDEAIGTLLRNVNGEEISKLITAFADLKKGTGTLTQKDVFSKSSALEQAYGNGSPLGCIPEYLRTIIYDFTPVKKAHWSQWHAQGIEFVNKDTPYCPYCGSEETDIIIQCRTYDESLKEKSLKAWLKVSTAIGDNASLFDPQAISTIDKVLSANQDPTDEDRDNFKQLVREVTDTANALSELRSINVVGRCDSQEVQSTLKSAYTVISSPKKFFSKDVGILINETIKAIDSALENFDKIERLTNEQNLLIKRAVENHEEEINIFLKEAGYPYKIEISLDKNEQAALILKDVNTAHPALKTKEFLSYGERNAITLVLLLYEVLEDKPDLIIFDDPISSFDGDKRFAILYTLFSKTQKLIEENLSGKTTVVLTHDFLIVSDLFRVVRDSLDVHGITGLFLHVDEQGVLYHKRISRDSVESYPKIIRKLAHSSKSSFIKLVYARRYIELMKEAERNLTPAWHILSSLLHKKSEVKTYENIPLNADDEKFGIEIIESLIGETFDFDTWNASIKDPSCYLIDLYENGNLPAYEKLQIVRTMIIENEKDLFEDDKSIQIRYANETYHLGGDYLFQLDPCIYNQTPNIVEKWCDSVVKNYKTAYELSNDECVQ